VSAEDGGEAGDVGGDVALVVGVDVAFAVGEDAALGELGVRCAFARSPAACKLDRCLA
jgi:hypothetical protein